MQHKLENHRTFRRPAQLDGLPAGSKVGLVSGLHPSPPQGPQQLVYCWSLCLQVTIRTYGKMRPPVTSAVSRLLLSPSSLVQPIIIKTEQQRSLIQKSPALSKSPRSPTKRPVSRRVQVNRSDWGQATCLLKVAPEEGLMLDRRREDLPAGAPRRILGAQRGP